MTPIDTSALDAPADCKDCNGVGWPGARRCITCNGSGFDPRVLLRATQTVGKLLERLVAQVDQVWRWIGGVRWPQ